MSALERRTQNRPRIYFMCVWSCKSKQWKRHVVAIQAELNQEIKQSLNRNAAIIYHTRWGTWNPLSAWWHTLDALGFLERLQLCTTRIFRIASIRHDNIRSRIRINYMLCAFAAHERRQTAPHIIRIGANSYVQKEQNGFWLAIEWKVRLACFGNGIVKIPTEQQVY